MNLFYLICPIGFEELLLEELEYKWSKHLESRSYKVVSREAGGIEIECELQDGLLLNRILKIPTRILLRVKNQKCRDLPKLFNILKKINWKTYLKQENIEFKVVAKKSRLIHTDRIEDTATKALKFYFEANKISEKKKLIDISPQAIHLRFFDDTLDISLDTSGELLHIRETGEYRGLASIRETFAAALILSLLKFKRYKAHNLLDPMCGSGTFLKETNNFFEINNRKFAYQNWTTFEEKDLSSLDNHWEFDSLLGNEINESVFNKVKEEGFNITNGDFFNFKQMDKGILILNPPYGKRVKIEGKPQLYFDSLIKHIKEKIRPKKFGIIIPRSFAQKYNPSERISFNQNGIKVDFLIFKIK